MLSLEKKEIQHQPQNKIWFWLSWALLALVVLWYFLSLVHPLHAINQDLGRFIALTREIFDTWHIPSVNTFSYTYPNFEFVNSHWLGGVLLTGLVGLFGFSGLVIVKSLIILTAVALAIYLSYKRITFDGESRLVLLVLFTIPTIIIALERTHARPEIFSHFLFVVIFALLLGTRRGWRWLIPVLMLIWVNIHIYFILGFLLIGAFIIESIIREKWSRNTRNLIIIGISSVGATLLNTAGLQGLLYPLQVFKNYGYTIVENQTPFFLIPFNYHHGTIATIFVMVIVLIVSFIVNWKRIRVSDVIIGIGLIFLSLTAIRHAFIFAVGILPILSYNISSALSRIPRGWFEEHDINILMLRRSMVALGLCVFVILGSIRANAMSIAVPEYVGGAVDFVIENKIDGNMFNNFDIGGYLIYRLYPERRIFVDNRPEAYPAEFFEQVYKPMQENPNVWRAMVQRYNIEYVIFGSTDQTPWGQNFMRMIMTLEEWTAVYVDETSLVLLRSDVARFQNIIEKYGFNTN